MGRPQAFDTEEAVRAARKVFWAQGYEEAAMPTLESATGLCRSSIYHAFGNKRGLFDAAVASYLDEVVRPALRPLITEPVAATAVIEYLNNLRGLIEHVNTDAESDGCLLINTACSPLVRDPAIRQVVINYRAELSAALLSGIRARRPEQQLARSKELAHTCAGLIVAAFSIVKADPQGGLDYLDLAKATVDAA
jgi:TetR/AcrR family transcriptional regulator, transcriptional repressor for nem operon